MDSPTGELHLRRLLEDALDPARAARDPVRELEAAGEALAAVGLVDASLTVQLLDLLRLARAVRSEPTPWPLPRLGSTPAPQAPPSEAPAGPRAVAVGPVDLAHPGGSLRVVGVSVGDDGTTLHAALDTDPSAGDRSARRPGALRGPTTRRSRPGPPASSRTPVAPQPPGSERHAAAARNPPATTLRGLRLGAGGTDPLEIGTAGQAPSGPGSWRLAGRAPGPGPTVGAGRAPGPGPTVGADRADTDRTVTIMAGGRVLSQLALSAPRPPLSGRAHRRSPAAVWVAGALDRVAAGVAPGPVGPAVRALVAVGALDATDSFAHQAALLDELTPTDDNGALDRRWRSALERRGAAPVVRGDWALAAFVDLGIEAVRLDSAHAGSDGLWVLGACGASREARPALVMSAYDDLLDAYSFVGPYRPLPDTAAWRLAPELDPRAQSLRIDITGSEREASVELSLR